MKELFLDELMIEARPGLRWTLHQPRKISPEPILKPDRPWEWRDEGGRASNGNGSVIWDPDDRLFKMWYETWGPSRVALSIAYAISTDGIQWEKPELGAVEYEGSTRNNLVFTCQRAGGTSLSALKDPRDPDPARRYKLFYADNVSGIPDTSKIDEGMTAARPTPRRGGCAAFSPDGVRWTPHPGNPVWPFKPEGPNDSLRTIYDARREKFVCYDKVMREVYGRLRRVIAIAESDDFLHWSDPEVVLQPDEADPLNVDFYGLTAFLYEGIYVGPFWTFHTVPDSGREARMDGRTDVQLASSRDGRVWTRVADRQTFIPLGPPASYEYGQLSTLTTGGAPLVVGDEIRIYYGACGGRTGTWDAAVMLGTLRLDGFASLDADELGGHLLTKPFLLTGGAIALNVATGRGLARVALLDEASNPLPGFSTGDCAPIRQDALRCIVRWGGGADLSALRGRQIRLRVELTNGSLYAYEQLE